jgi:hypothetical protein
MSIKSNKQETWAKLNKATKINKLTNYAQTYCQNNKLSSSKCHNLILFFRNSLDEKRLLDGKDVVYNKETQTIDNVPCLKYVDEEFLLERHVKQESLLNSLTPKNIKMKQNKQNKK